MKPLTDSSQLSKIILKGFKSIADCTLQMGALNILIGPNGGGKSNFISFFRMIQNLIEGALQLYVGKQGGPDSLLHYGRKVTEQLEAELYFGNNGYKITLEPTHDNRMMFSKENFWSDVEGDRHISSGHFESLADTQKRLTIIYHHTVFPIKNLRVYHFHDTSDTAYMKQAHRINDNKYLRPDAKNLAAFLYLLKEKHETEYGRIVKTIRLAAPFFNDFHLRPSPQNTDMIELEWTEKGHDEPFKAHLLSDGTLRFICLTAVFLQPAEFQPDTIIVDEPELGLHPYAIVLLASLMKSAASRRQIIVSTQSVELLNEFDAEDVVVVNREHRKSEIYRLNPADLAEWLNDYSLGELWNKNLFGGRPGR